MHLHCLTVLSASTAQKPLFIIFLGGVFWLGWGFFVGCLGVFVPPQDHFCRAGCWIGAAQHPRLSPTG